MLGVPMKNLDIIYALSNYVKVANIRFE